MIPVTTEQLQALAPDAQETYRTAFARADAVLAPFGVNANPRRLAHFMAQVLHETGGFTILQENLNYHAERLMQVWKERFPTLASTKGYAHNPQPLANKVYGGRMGNVEPNDGWRYRGRGLLQLTGRASYAKAGRALGIDLVGNPDLAMGVEWCLPIAGHEWRARGCNALADADDIRGVSRAINGGLIGLPARRDWLAKTKHVWLPATADVEIETQKRS